MDIEIKSQDASDATGQADQDVHQYPPCNPFLDLERPMQHIGFGGTECQYQMAYPGHHFGYHDAYATDFSALRTPAPFAEAHYHFEHSQHLHNIDSTAVGFPPSPGLDSGSGDAMFQFEDQLALESRTMRIQSHPERDAYWPAEELGTFEDGTGIEQLSDSGNTHPQNGDNGIVVSQTFLFLSLPRHKASALMTGLRFRWVLPLSSPDTSLDLPRSVAVGSTFLLLRWLVIVDHGRCGRVVTLLVSQAVAVVLYPNICIRSLFLSPENFIPSFLSPLVSWSISIASSRHRPVTSLTVPSLFPTFILPVTQHQKRFPGSAVRPKAVSHTAVPPDPCLVSRGLDPGHLCEG